MQRAHRKQVGFSLVEVMISLGILVAVVALAMHFLISSWDSQSYLQLESHLKSQSEIGLNRMGRYVAQARRIFSKGTVGTNYISKLAMNTAPRPIPNSQLPDVRTSGSMAPEKNCQVSPSEYFLPNAVGNSLLFAELVQTFKVLQGSGGPPTYPRDLDIYRFNYLYITDYAGSSSTNLVNNNQPTLGYAQSSSASLKRAQNLIEWHSRNVVDYSQLKAYYDFLDSKAVGSEKTLVGNSLRSVGVLTAWKRDENTPNNSFYEIKDNGTLVLLNNDYKLPMATYQDTLRLQSSGEGTYTIAYNREGSKLAPGYYPIRTKVPYYYSPTLPSGLTCPQVTPVPTATPNQNFDFPRGFETMVVGPQSGRSVLMRVTVVGKGYAKSIVEYSHTLTISARDL